MKLGFHIFIFKLHPTFVLRLIIVICVFQCGLGPIYQKKCGHGPSFENKNIAPLGVYFIWLGLLFVRVGIFLPKRLQAGTLLNQALHKHYIIYSFDCFAWQI